MTQTDHRTWCHKAFICVSVFASLFFAIPAYIPLSSSMNALKISLGELIPLLLFGGMVYVPNLSYAQSQPFLPSISIIGPMNSLLVITHLI